MVVLEGEWGVREAGEKVSNGLPVIRLSLSTGKREKRTRYVVCGEVLADSFSAVNLRRRLTTKYLFRIKYFNFYKKTTRTSKHI
jgi:hypothetical protein